MDNKSIPDNVSFDVLYSVLLARYSHLPFNKISREVDDLMYALWLRKTALSMNIQDLWSY